MNQAAPMRAASKYSFDNTRGERASRMCASAVRGDIPCSPQDESDDQPRPIDTCLTANEDAVPRLPALSCVGSDLTDPVKVARIELGVGEPVPNLLNAPRGRLCVCVESDDEVERSLAPIVAWLGRLTEQA